VNLQSARLVAQRNSLLMAGTAATVSVAFQTAGDLTRRVLYGAAFFSDETGSAGERAVWVSVEPQRVYVPVLLRDRVVTACPPPDSTGRRPGD